MYATILLACLFIYFVFRQYRLYQYRKFELQLFQLRDKLRDHAMSGKMKSTDWIFHYLDSSISKMTCNFKMINIFHAMYLRNKHQNDLKLEQFKKTLESSLDNNQAAREIYDEYLRILTRYLIHKHVFLFSFVLITIYGYLRSVTQYKKYALETEDSIAKLTILPETSASQDFIKNYKYSYA